LNNQLKLLEYSDSDWEKDLELKRFTLKYIFKIINESVFWSSKHQKIIILFFYKAEYMILTETTKKAVWMKKLFKELKLKNVRYITHDSCATSVVPPFNRLWAWVSAVITCVKWLSRSPCWWFKFIVRK